MPLARQNWSSVSSGLHSIRYDLSGGLDKLGRGSSYEFPWKEPAGTHLVNQKELINVRGLLLPHQAGSPKALPIVWWTAKQDVSPDTFDSHVQKIEWAFPHGTVFVELLARRLSNGSVVPFEVRTRTREEGEWAVDVFRPFVHASDLSAALARLGQHEESVRLVRKPVRFSVRLHDTQHKHPAIDIHGVSERLPHYSADLVKNLLQGRVFESALGEDWREQGPVTAPSGGIYPENYRAVMSVDRESCFNCHRSTNVSVSHFDSERDWYGNVRGSDGILSFHIFDQSGISMDGRNVPVVFRSELLKWGLLVRYKPSLPFSSSYSTLKR